MNKKDATVIKVLADLELRDPPELDPEQERLLQLALDPEEKFLDDVERLFTQKTQK